MPSTAPTPVNDAATPGTPQYQVQYIGTGRAESALDTGSNSDALNYGTATLPDNVAFYRVTARSSAPADLNGRSIVVLQTPVQRPL
jgi:hypothetical protein